MDWPTLEIDSWKQFAELAAKITLPNPTVVAYLMRGQSDRSWGLTPSLLRNFPKNVTAEQALAVESYGLAEFQAQAHLHLPAQALPPALPPGSAPEWWSLMQHYYAPTRLLDWTLSAYVAAYYAVERDIERDGVIYVLHAPTVSRHFSKHFPDGSVTDEVLKDPKAPATLMVWSPRKRTERFVAQQGFFTFSVNILGNHDDVISDTCGAARREDSKTLFFESWVVPAKLKREFLRKLRTMNIAAHSLFPGIDGLGRSLAETARLASTF